MHVSTTARVLTSALVAVVLLGGVTPAHAVITTLNEQGTVHVPAQRIVNAADSRAAMPSVTVKIMWGACPTRAEASCTGQGQAIWWNIGAGHGKNELLHEIGHHVDYAQDTQARDEFRRLIGDTRPWRTSGGNSPHEKFAEAWSMCAGARTNTFDGRVHGEYAYEVTVRAHRRFCDLVERTANRLRW